MIIIENLVKTFGDVVAVNDASFTARDTEITTLLGANGSGKSTLMRAIAGLLEPDAGRVIVDKIHVAEKTLDARKKIGLFPDQFGLYPRLTAREHLEYYAKFHGLSGRALNDGIDEISSLLSMGDILNRRTEGFSQGQRMKVALGRTLIHKPKNLILDEPTRGLDVMNIRLLRNVLKSLRDQGRCILLSSHVMAEVQELSDRVVIINKGEITADGTPKTLIDEMNASDLEDAFIKSIAS